MIARIALVLIVALVGCRGPSEAHPTDAELLERFRAHRAELEQLVAMFQMDKGLGRVGDDFTRPDDTRRVGVTAERIQEYRRLCAKVGAPDCIEGYDAAYERLDRSSQSDAREEKDPIWIHVSAIGLSITGSGKGFLYSEHPALPVVSDLDHISSRTSGTWLRRIEGPWYLYYEYED